jgi:predicted transcriptional regulator
MINPDIRETIKTLFAQGKKKKEIARLLNLTPKSVRKHLKDEKPPTQPSTDQSSVDIELLRTTYARCGGYRERMLEVLKEEQKWTMSYSTFTRLLRQNGIGQKSKPYSAQVPDRPGEEMQHDTTIYQIDLGGKRTRVVASSLYLRYSKLRHVQFYPFFNRWCMQCCLHEALRYWGYVAHRCVIDNTNLAIYHGTGSSAVFHPQMIAFAKRYGFTWLAHAKGHANRKAGCERSFYTLETNFLPGRSFKSFEDLNQQVLKWCEAYARRPQSKTKLIPKELFEIEKPDLIHLPDYIQPPYQEHRRLIDQYGFIAFDSNYYWVPDKSAVNQEIKLLEYPKTIKVFPKSAPALEYPLPPVYVKRKKFSPPGMDAPHYQPRRFRKSCQQEETRLRALDAAVVTYLDWIHSANCDIPQKTVFIRQLYNFSQKLTLSLFLDTLQRAMKHRIADIEALKRIARQLLQQEFPASDLPGNSLIHDYEQRETYQSGRFSQEQQSELYHNFMKNRDKDEEDIS